MLKFFDSHSHLQFPAFDADRDAVVFRMREAGLGTIVIGTNRLTSAAAIALADRLGGDFYSSVAVHPGHVFAPRHDPDEQAETPQEEMFDEKIFTELLTRSKKVVGVGECGLDYFRLPDDQNLNTIKEKQAENFTRHLIFAKTNNLPLIVHSRDAFADTFALLKDAGVAGVMHCFTGSVAEAKAYLELGFYISLTCAVTYGPRKTETENPLQALAKYVPLDRLLIETDSPYLAPLALRGSRNEPLNVIEAAKKIAELRGIGLEELAAATTKNAVKLFHLADRF